MNLKLAALRRIRLRSKEDVIVLVVALAVYLVLYYGLPKIKPDISEKAVKVICIIAMIAVGFIMAMIL